jgi:ASC-1-like (ASCH) protein
MLKHQGLLRELEDKENLINKVNTLLETTKEQKDIIEQNLADERAKTAKMLDKLSFSKSELENAQKYIDKLKKEKKSLQ